MYAVLCIPEVEYSSEPRCPREVTFTCNALEFGRPTISWFAGDTVLAEYNYIATDVYPKEVMTDSINATAQISQASFTTSSFNYINFTLSVKLDELDPFQGQNFTCGTTSIRSSDIPVDSFEVLGKTIK